MALGAGIGAVCGAWAGLLVDIWCPLVNLPHVLFGHVLPLALLVAAGTLLGQRVLGVRRGTARPRLSASCEGVVSGRTVASRP